MRGENLKERWLNSSRILLWVGFLFYPTAICDESVNIMGLESQWGREYTKSEYISFPKKKNNKPIYRGENIKCVTQKKRNKQKKEEIWEKNLDKLHVKKFSMMVGDMRKSKRVICEMLNYFITAIIWVSSVH